MATRKLGLSALMAAVYTRLANDADIVTSVSTRVYNYAPRDTAFPFVTFDSPIGTESARISTRDTEGESNVFTVHVWSDEAGDKQCADILGHVVDAIMGTALSITGYNTPFDVALDYSDVMRDDSDATRIVFHGVARFRVEMKPA
jgi:hypothetical protein